MQRSRAISSARTGSRAQSRTGAPRRTRCKASALPHEPAPRTAIGRHSTLTAAGNAWTARGVPPRGGRGRPVGAAPWPRFPRAFDRPDPAYPLRPWAPGAVVACARRRAVDREKVPNRSNAPQPTRAASTRSRATRYGRRCPRQASERAASCRRCLMVEGFEVHRAGSTSWGNPPRTERSETTSRR